nr:hypothetical protein [Tanacetum cinerariifolium]
EVIINEDSPAPIIFVDGVVQPVTHKSVDQKLARRNELKAHGTLLMALPDKHQLKFNSHKDAKTLMEAIEKRFRGNTETKKIHDRLQKLVSQLEIHRVSLSQEDVNLKFLHSLPSEWKIHTLIWRNKADLEEHSLDDLFNISAATSVSAVCAKLPGPQLDHEDLKKIDVDDLEEMNLRWQMAMLTIRARRFLQKTGKNMGDNKVTSMGFDMSKVECYNCHIKGHFARECRSPKDSRRSGATEPQRRTAPVENSTSNALVSQYDGIWSYDWSYQAEEEPANFALMAITSSSSSSDNEVPSCSKACLESVEARLVVYKQNESILEENINLLNNEVQARDNVLITLRQKLNQAEQERDDLKLKLEKFQSSSKNLTELLASQTNDKHGLGYFSSESNSKSLSPSSLSDRIQPSGGYHVVLPPITRTFMPPKPDLVFYTAPIDVETNHSAFTVQLSPSKPAQDLSHINRPSAPITEDWVFDSEDESEPNDPQSVPRFVQSSEHAKTPRHSVQTPILDATLKSTSPKSNSSGKRKNIKTCFVCRSVDNLIKDYDFHAMKKAQPTPRNYAHRGNNKQNASFPHKYPPMHMAPAVVLTQSKPVYITAARPVCADVPKIMVTRPRHAHSFDTKSKSPIRRHITHSPSSKTSNSPPRVTTAQALVVSAAKGKKEKWSNDVIRLQALVDRKKVVVIEAAIRDVLRLDDAEGVDCQPNEEIFAELARMGYEKPSTKLTFYKDFFSRQWKFLIHTILQSMSAKRTSWNEFSSAMASAIICLSTEGGKRMLRVETPLFEGMLVVGEPEKQGNADEQVQGNDNDAAQGVDTAVTGNDVQDQSIPSPAPPTPPPKPPQDILSTSQERRVEHLERDKVAQDLKITKLKTRVKKLERANKERMIADLDRDTGVALMDDEGTKNKAKDAQVVGDEQVKWRQADIYQIDLDHAAKVLSMQEDELEVQEAVEVVTTAKLITEVVAAVSESVSAASANIDVVPATNITAAPVRVVVASTRRRKRVVIRDPEEESTIKIPDEAKSKDKGKGIMVEEPKPMKKKQQVKMDEAYVRKLHEELNQDIDWDVAVDHVKQKAKEDPYVQRYQVMKKRPQTEAQAQRNMIMYLKNTTGFRLDYFKGIALESINETPAQKAAKRRKLNEEVKDVKEIKQHLEIVPDEDDDVYTEAIPLARKVPVVDYQIIQLNNKHRYKIIRADGTHQLYSNVWKTIWTRSSLEESKKCPWSSKERKYPLLRFTLDQMLNAVRLQVEKQSKMSLELISFGVDAAMELEEKH